MGCGRPGVQPRHDVHWRSYCIQYGYAPEMNAVVDDVFKLFRDAGYRVGVTLRPQRIQWGTQLPATCTYSPIDDFKSYFVKVDGPFGATMHSCYDPNGILWAPLPVGNGAQQNLRVGQAREAFETLKEKAAYARSRWGVTLFYVDSAVYSGGAVLEPDVFKQLHLEFPDSLFIPEQQTMEHVAYSMPFTDPRNPGDPVPTPDSWRWVYPQAGMSIWVSDCGGDCWAQSRSAQVGPPEGRHIHVRLPWADESHTTPKY